MNLNATLLGEMVTFAIFVWFTLKFVIPPIQKTIEERQVTAQETEANFAKSKAKLDSDTREGQKLIENARSEANMIEQEARSSAKSIVQAAETDAKNKANKIATDNEKKLEQMYSQMMAELKSEFATKVIAAGVEAVLKKNMSDAMNLEIIDSLITEEI